ncbi:MAG TPA: Hsp20/alpha crystallin family protein [Terriglobia bacterium]|nr:Hsp20/alpha crystallin family protein [Terriglobia bacterium]
MAIVRWEPFRDLVTTQDNFNRLFNETFRGLFGETESGTQTWAPAVDIYESDQNLVLKAELPGFDPKEVEVRVEDGTLYLKGERKFESDVKKENYHRIERSYGSFTRTFSLPSSINAENVTAEYKDGVLTLTMPKKEEAKPKTIKIQVSEPARAAAAAAHK